MAAQLLMPKATAVWLVDNTSLTFDQIAEFCGLHKLEVKGIADGDVAQGIKGISNCAARKGNADAQIEYAILLFKGRGVAKDQARAAEFMRSSAIKGNPVAQNRLARLYAYGVAVKQDLVLAATWHLISRAAGIGDMRLDILLSQLTKTQRLTAEKAAENWKTGDLLR